MGTVPENPSPPDGEVGLEVGRFPNTKGEVTDGEGRAVAVHARERLAFWLNLPPSEASPQDETP